MLQGFWHDNQYALCRTGQQLLVQDHPGFNGFTQANFVRQQYARGVTTANVMGNVELMWDKAGALAAQAAPRHAVLFALIFTRAVAQRETIHTVNLAGKETVLWFAKHQFAVEQHFAQHHVLFFGVLTGTDVRQQTIFFFNFINEQLPAFMACYRVAGIEHHAGHGGVTTGVQTVLSGCRKE